MRLKGWFSTTVKLALSVGLIVFLLSRIALREIGDSLLQAKPLYVAGGILVIPLLIYLRSYLMSLILATQDVRIPPFRIMLVNFSTAFYALFLPGIIAGGGVRWYKLSIGNRRYSEVLVAIIFNRLFNTITMLLLGLVFFAIDRSTLSSAQLGSAMGVCFILLCLSYWALFGSSLPVSIKSALSRWRLPATLERRMVEVLEAIERFRFLSAREVFLFSAISLGFHLIGVLSTYLLSMALSLPLGVVTICWIRALLFFILLMPFSISGIGVREGSLVWVLQHYGVSPASAMAFSFLLLGRDMAGALTGGIVELVGWFRNPQSRRRRHAEKAGDSV